MGGIPSTAGGGASLGGASVGGAALGGASGLGGASLGGKAGGGAPLGGAAGLGGASLGGAGGAGGAATSPFMLGADISSVPELEDLGVKFYDGGIQKEFLQLLKDHGFNFVRLRTFHNPRALGGYSAAGYCDLEHTIAMGKRLKGANLGFYLDFHYSDNFADPAQQNVPAAWVGLAFPALTQAVHDYTKDALTQLKAAGAQPDMVQLGNEITGGILWTQGKTYSPDNRDQLAILLSAAISAVEEVDPTIKVVMHLDPCGNNTATRWWLDSMFERGVRFAILGESCYTQWQGDPSIWEANFADLMARYPELSFMASEYSHEKRRTNDVIRALGPRGLGTFIWEPTFFGETLFDESGTDLVTNPLMALYDQMAEDFGLR